MKQIVTRLSETLILEVKSKLKWFLSLHIIWNQLKQALWLSQKVYISKICNKLAPALESQLSNTLMEPAELLSLSKLDKQPTEAIKTLYQWKIRSLLYAAIVTRPDIRFVIFRLSRFNIQPEKQHHAAANCVFHYFAQTQNHCIWYGGEPGFFSFVYASDASFANNSLDQKSF